MAVKTKNAAQERRDPSTLRAFCARNRVSYTELARMKGCRVSYISDVLRAEVTGKRASEGMYDELWRLALRIVRQKG